MGLGKQSKELGEVKIKGVGYYANEDGVDLTIKDLANPKCDPWILIKGTSQPPEIKNYSFLYQPLTGKLKFRHHMMADWQKIKRSRLIYKILIEKLEKVEFKLYNPTLLGYKGKSILTTGYIYTPHIPICNTPTVISNTTKKPIGAINCKNWKVYK